MSWSLHDQLTVAEGMRRVTWSWSSAALQAPDWRTLPRAALAVLALAAAVVLLARRRRAAAGAAAPAMPRFYARALRALARRGVAPATGETARELVARAGEGPEAALARLTGAYERVRFGGAALTATEMAEVEACLAALERARV